MLVEQSPQLPLADAESVGQCLDASLAVEQSFADKASARDTVLDVPRHAAASGENLRPAAQAGAKTCFLCRRGAGKEPDVLRLGRPRRADRPAIDARRGDTDEDAPVERGIARAQRTQADVFGGRFMIRL